MATIGELYTLQSQNQQLMLFKGMYENREPELVTLPIDDVSLSSYHVLQLQSEIGEVLDADKRWKNFRNDKYDKEAKSEEIADCFIEVLNLAMFSGISASELEEAVSKKMRVIFERVSAQEVNRE